MPDFVKSIGHFFESHVEKIVLVIVGIVCAVLFFKYVIFSPNTVTVGKTRYTPSQIDKAVAKKAEELRARINRPRDKGEKAPKYRSVLSDRIDPNKPFVAGIVDQPLTQGFMGLFRSPLSFVTDQASIVPPARTVVTTSGRRYKLPPRIGAVTEAAVGYIRAAAWVPTEPLTPQLGYDKVDVEANDVDMVTIEGKFDAAELYRQFRSHFNGEEVAKREWRDPCLAEPVFASVQLQRQTLGANGAWSEWQDVPRSRVESNAELFQVAERLSDMPAGTLEVRMMQLRRLITVMDLLQPEPYQIASAEEDWFPPSFYDKFKLLQKKVDLEARREEREKNRDQLPGRDSGRFRPTGGPGGGAGQTTGTGGRYRSTGAGGAGDTYGTGAGGLRGRTRGGQTPQDGMYGGGADDPRMRRGATKTRGRGLNEAASYDGAMYPGVLDPTQQKASTNEVYLDFSEAFLTYRTKLNELEKPLLFWRIDDTAQPGNTYRYRMRLGVFNPVVGTGQLVEQDMDKKDQVVLWSDFSSVVGPVTIPEKMYFFAKDVQAPKKSAMVEVARYTLGYWRCENFEVKPGEAIGREMKPAKKPEVRRRPGDPAGRLTDPALAANGILGVPPEMAGGNYYPYPGQTPADAPKSETPEIIDYRTGKVLVDLVQVNDWGDAPNLRPRAYHEMLYTADGQTIEHMPVSTTYWPKDMLIAYQGVSTESKKEQQPFRDFKKGSFRSRSVQGLMDAYPGGMYPDAMMNPQGMVDR